MVWRWGGTGQRGLVVVVVLLMVEVMMSVADLLTAVGNLMGVLWYLFRDALSQSKTYCDTHSALTIFSSIASFLWTTATALSLFLVLVRHAHEPARRFWKPIWLLCWGVPSGITIAALSWDVLGYDSSLTQASWCWIDPDTPLDPLWNFLTGKAWELLAYVLTVILYTAVRISLLRHKVASDRVLTQRHTRRDGVRDANVKLMFIPLVFIVLRLWGTLRFLVGYVDYRVANSPYFFWVILLQGFGDTAQGFCNFLMDVLFTPNVRRRLFARRNNRGSDTGQSSLHSGTAPRVSSVSTIF